MNGPQRPDHVGVLTIRTWVEPETHSWRARVIQSSDVHGGDSKTSVFVTVDDVCDAVRNWLEECIRYADG